MRLDDLLPLHMKLRSVLSSGKRLNHAEPAKPTDTLKARYTNLLLENEVWMPLSRRGWEDLCMLRSQISLPVLACGSFGGGSESFAHPPAASGPLNACRARLRRPWK